MNYLPIIGLEVHVELKTKSKMFCSCSTEYFGEKPNSHTCPVCLGLPGALPVPNKLAVEWCMMIAMALHCSIPAKSKFDRKNYFYPDLPKGYQISQFDEPFGTDGYIEVGQDKKRKIRIRRVHMEEDTGKLTHELVDGKRVTLIDFNRSGVPLVEIVTEPDFQNAAQVKEYLQKLQQIVRYLGVSQADMEKGEMRLEPNISLTPLADEKQLELSYYIKPYVTVDGSKNEMLPAYKVEVKNINSFGFVEKAIAYEINRQSSLLNKGETPRQETRGWDEDKKMTVVQRVKEEAGDYRYFPEPDIPPIEISEKWYGQIYKNLPEMPDAKKIRFEEAYKLTPYNAEILTREPELAAYFEEAVRVGKKHTVDPTKIANTIINKKVQIDQVLPAKLIEDIIVGQKVAVMDAVELKQIILSVLSENEKAVEEYKAGKETVFMFLFGTIMKRLPVKIDPQILREELKRCLT